MGRRRKTPKQAKDAPGMTRSLMEWLPSKEAPFLLARACHHLAGDGFRGWAVGRFIRKSPLFFAVDFDVSLPAEFQAISFRLSKEGQREWQRRHLHGTARRPRRRTDSSRKPSEQVVRGETGRRRAAPSPDGPSRRPREERKEVTSLAGFALAPDNVRLTRACIRERGGGDWLPAAELYPSLRDTFHWSDSVAKGMISSALGMLAAMGDIERRKHRGRWEFRVS